MELFILCIKIFFGRLIDVSLGTLVTIYVVKNEKNLATIIGFIDVFIWFVVVKEALNTDIESIWVALSYSLGYAAGTYVGSGLSQIFSYGKVNMQVITKNLNNVSKALKNSNFSASVIKCMGIHKEDNNYMIYSQIENKKVREFKKLIIDADENAFVTVTESKESLNGYFGK